VAELNAAMVHREYERRLAAEGRTAHHGSAAKQFRQEEAIWVARAAIDVDGISDGEDESTGTESNIRCKPFCNSLLKRNESLTTIVCQLQAGPNGQRADSRAVRADTSISQIW
jgi:hypothetical protein